MFGLGHTEIVILLVLAVMLFGSRLPEVGRSLGKSLMEFRKGMSGLEDELRTLTRLDVHTPVARVEPPSPPAKLPTAPKFEPPPSSETA